MSLAMKGSPTNGDATKEPATNVSTVDMSSACGDAPDGVKEHKHKPSQHSNMLRSFSLQARICRLCGCLFVKDMFAKPPRSLPGLQCILGLRKWSGFTGTPCTPRRASPSSCGSRRTWSRGHAIELSDIHRFFTKSLLVLLHVVVIIKACCNFFTMAIGARRIVEFLQKADAFEKEVGIPSCQCCGQRAFFWTDLGGIVTFIAYFVSYTSALIHQEQKVDRDGQLSAREIANRVLGFFAAFLFFTYDSVNFVLERYVLYLKHCIDGCVGCKVVGSEEEAAQKIQAVRLHLCTVLELKNAINSIWHRSIVVSCVGLLLVTCISLYTIITEGLRKTELWIAIGYSAFTSYEFLELARVSQSLSNAVQYLHSTINPDDISLNGSDFFKINLSLLVSTSPEYEATPTCQPVTMVTTTPAVT
ncbi:hypothetical protein MTO96_022336 [Rhipicephalus appendiculatus]